MDSAAEPWAVGIRPHFRWGLRLAPPTPATLPRLLHLQLRRSPRTCRLTASAHFPKLRSEAERVADALKMSTAISTAATLFSSRSTRKLPPQSPQRPLVTPAAESVLMRSHGLVAVCRLPRHPYRVSCSFRVLSDPRANLPARTPWQNGKIPVKTGNWLRRDQATLRSKLPLLQPPEAPKPPTGGIRLSPILTFLFDIPPGPGYIAVRWLGDRPTGPAFDFAASEGWFAAAPTYKSIPDCVTFGLFSERSWYSLC